MKAYGLPRFSWLDYPDLGDMKNFALKGSVGNFQKKGGDYPSMMRSKQKRQYRRVHKQWARHQAKLEIKEAVNEEIMNEEKWI